MVQICNPRSQKTEAGELVQFQDNDYMVNYRPASKQNKTKLNKPVTANFDNQID